MVADLRAIPPSAHGTISFPSLSAQMNIQHQSDPQLIGPLECSLGPYLFPAIAGLAKTVTFRLHGPTTRSSLKNTTDPVLFRFRHIIASRSRTDAEAANPRRNERWNANQKRRVPIRA